MNTLAVETHPLAQNVEFTDDDLVVSLVDGRKVIVPLVLVSSLSERHEKSAEALRTSGRW